MAKKMTKKDIEKEIKKNFRQIKILIRLLETLHQLALLNKDMDNFVFEEKVKAHIGEKDFDYIKHFVKYEGDK